MTRTEDPDFDRWAFTDLRSLREEYLNGKPEAEKMVDWIESQMGFVEWIAQKTMQWSPRWQNFDMNGELRDNRNAGEIAHFAHPQDRAHVALNDPQTALSRVAADRKTLAECKRLLAVDGWEYTDTPELAQLVLDNMAEGYGWGELEYGEGA